MKTLSLIVLVLSFAITTPVTAIDKNKQYGSLGKISCGKWIVARKTMGLDEIARIWWISGYITAYNGQTPDVFDILGNTDAESAHLWMDKYCQENPLSNLAEGMKGLTIELWPNRKRTKDD